MTLIIIFSVVALIIFFIFIWIIGIYNGLVKLRILTDNSWSDIDVQLKKRRNLIPNLVETVKGYASHEKETLEAVIEARNQAANAGSIGEQIKAETSLSGVLSKLFALSEAYPELKANQGFLDLQKEISEIENDIADARRYYNAVIRDFNTKIQVFPSNIVASMFNFMSKPFFEIDDNSRENPEVKF